MTQNTSSLWSAKNIARSTHDDDDDDGYNSEDSQVMLTAVRTQSIIVLKLVFVTKLKVGSASE